MEIEILENKGLEVTFVIRGINSALANTLRRISMSEVPSMAIDEINFLKNSSALYDEMIAHRLGLVPLKTDLKSYNLRENCTCKGEGCAKCQLNLKLDVKGPETVYSSNLKSQDPEVSPVIPNLPIVLLLKNQRLEIEATARLGKGSEHTKFSPCLVYFKQYPEIKGKEVTFEQYMQDSYPEDANIKLSETDFIFTIESWGQLTPKEILKTSLDIFEERLDEFSKKLKKVT